MKKNAMLKIAAVLLVAVLLTTCAISSTFAKYTSTASSGEATARVAKWGLKATATLTGGFGKTYSEGNMIVSSAGDDAVIAPGTSGEFTLSTAYTGTPEVSYDIICNATVTTGSVPIKFYVNGDKNTSYDAAGIKTKIEEEFNRTNVQPSTAVSANNDTMKIQWEWDFDTEDPTGANRDNALGNAYINDSAQETVSLSFSLNITQTGAAGDADSYFGANNQ